MRLIVLGVAQDAGLPHVGCDKLCCQRAWSNPSLRRFATCVAVVDEQSHERWMFECTPDFAWQLHLLDQLSPRSDANRAGLDGILLSHAHIGHYSGLMLLGREALGADGVPVFALPRMSEFLSENGPWSQLVSLNNIQLQRVDVGQHIKLNHRVHVEPFLVPHRDEFSETVGFKIVGPARSVLFIPDIDKWERWETPVEELIETVDLALLDGTFYSGEELPHRDMAEIPHPFIVESVQRFGALKPSERRKVHFIHLNHSNPAHYANSAATAEVTAAGMSIARRGMTFGL